MDRDKDFFEKRKKRYGERKSGTRGDPKPNSFLIVSEGEKTEPLYFQGLADYVNNKYGKSIDVRERPSIRPEGIGEGTVKLVREAEKLQARSKTPYEQVWVVFDKDDFKDFDEAIKLTKKLGFKSAWSNRSFEYWLFLHFNYADSDSDDWDKKLSRIFKERKINPLGYKKNDPDIFQIVTEHGDLKQAILRAERIERTYPENVAPSLCKPCTKVHSLIKALKPYIADLLE